MKSNASNIQVVIRCAEDPGLGWDLCCFHSSQHLTNFHSVCSGSSCHLCCRADSVPSRYPKICGVLAEGVRKQTVPCYNRVWWVKLMAVKEIRGWEDQSCDWYNHGGKISSISPFPSHFFTHRTSLSITWVLIWKVSRQRGKNHLSWNDILNFNLIMNWPWINYWKWSLLWCLRRICLQCVSATFFHVHLSLNRAWYRHKTWF